MFKKLIILVIIFSIAATGIYYYQHLSNGTSQQQNSKSILTVDVVKIKHQTIHDEIEALGTAFANEAVNITSTDTDKIAQIRFEDGQSVKKDDVIVLLEQNEEQAQKQAIEAQVLEHERELKRLEDLLKRNAAAKNEFDARNTLLMISKHRIAEIEARINDKTIRAPFDGILGLRKISVGSLVVPGTIITTIDDISQIKLDFSVPSVYLDVVKEGLEIKAVSDALPDKAFVGKVTKVSPRVDPRTRSVEVRAILPNPDHVIKPGILLSVSLFRNEREALIVPEESIIQLQKNHYVFVTSQENNVERKQISIGKRHPGWVEVLSGLEEGEQVIVRGISRVRPGQQVQVKEVPFNIQMGH